MNTYLPNKQTLKIQICCIFNVGICRGRYLQYNSNVKFMHLLGYYSYDIPTRNDAHYEFSPLIGFGLYNTWLWLYLTLHAFIFLAVVM